MNFKIGDRIFVRGYIDEIRKDTVIVRNDGGYFGTVLSEVTGELPSAQPNIILCKDCKHRPTRDEDGWLDFPTERCPCQNEDDFYYSWMPKDDWFCGNAERREG